MHFTGHGKYTETGISFIIKVKRDEFMVLFSTEPDPV